MTWNLAAAVVVWLAAAVLLIGAILQQRRKSSPDRTWVLRNEEEVAKANRIELLNNLKKIVEQQSETIVDLHKIVEKLQSQIKEALNLYLQCEDERKDILTRVEKMEEAFARTNG